MFLSINSHLTQRICWWTLFSHNAFQRWCSCFQSESHSDVAVWHVMCLCNTGKSFYCPVCCQTASSDGWCAAHSRTLVRTFLLDQHQRWWCHQEVSVTVNDIMFHVCEFTCDSVLTLTWSTSALYFVKLSQCIKMMLLLVFLFFFLTPFLFLISLCSLYFLSFSFFFHRFFLNYY